MYYLNYLLSYNYYIIYAKETQMLDSFSRITKALLTGFLFIIYFFLALILIPYFSSKIFHSHLLPSSTIKYIGICFLLILPSLVTYYLCYSMWQLAFIEVFGFSVINMLVSGRFLSSIVLFFVYVLWAVISGVLNKNQRVFFFCLNKK
jgi:hypothetical protein